MPDLGDGETVEVKGSAAKPYELRNVGEDQRLLAAGGSAAPPRRKTKARAEPVAGDEPQVEDGESAVLLAERWDGVLDPTGWWMSEKLDGVRAYWNGERFVSRLGNAFAAPSWFTGALPATPLDGELWAGRKQFQRAVSIVRSQDSGERWREISFVVFDAPALDAPFEERLEHCRTLLGQTTASHVSAHEHRPCKGVDALRAELARIEALGGEGLMLREPGSPYVAGRSSTLLKVKSFRDAEARVVEHLPGEGRHAGRLGALLVERPGGTRFAVGTGLSDAERAAPPPVGSVITYRYQELTDAGVPRFPTFLGMRDDVRLPPARSTPSTAAVVTSSDRTRRRFELSDGSAHKFWEISLSGSEVAVSFGRIGGSGQTKTKSFGGADQAVREAARLVDEKIAKGYRETS